MKIKYISMISLFVLGLCQCTNYDFSKRRVQQGNLLPSAKIARLKLGMSKEDVAVLMGTSLVNPMFNDNRWDYAYTIRVGTGKTKVSNLRLWFKNNRIVKIEKQA
jgi:outer membrane protein assembly factor BamE